MPIISSLKSLMLLEYIVHTDSKDSCEEKKDSQDLASSQNYFVLLEYIFRLMFEDFLFSIIIRIGCLFTIQL